MKISIVTADNITAEERKTIERLVRLGLTRFATAVRQVQVTVRDHDGSPGSHDRHCVLKMTLSEVPEIVIQESCPTAEQAVGLAVDRAARSLGRTLDRRMRNRDYEQRRLATGFEATEIDTARSG